MTNNTANLKYRALILFLCALALISFAHATLFVNTTIDKPSVYVNEVAYLTVKVFNDSNKTVPQVLLRIEGASNIVIIDPDEKQTTLHTIENIRAGETAEVKIKFKATATKKEPTALFVYYGEQQDNSDKGLPFVSGTVTLVKENAVTVAAKSEKQTDDAGQKIIITLDMQNKSGSDIHAIAAEVLAPTNFEVTTNPFVQQTLGDTNTLTTTFEVLVPLEAQGDQVITLGYGYFDADGPHYFEQAFTYAFVKNDKTILAIIGLIVLAAAVIIYHNQTKGAKVKGTADKK